MQVLVSLISVLQFVHWGDILYLYLNKMVNHTNSFLLSEFLSISFGATSRLAPLVFSSYLRR